MPTFEQVTTEFVSSGNNRVTLPKPSGLQVGDGMVVHIALKNGGANIAPPGAWIEHTDNTLSYVATKIADAADVVAANFQFIFASGLPSRCGSLMRFSDVLQGAFGDAFLLAGASGTPMVTPALVASRQALFIISGHSSSSFNRGQGSMIHTAPVGHTERADGTAFELGLGVFTKDVEVVSVGAESIISASPGNVANHTTTLAILGPIPTVTQAQIKGRREQLMSKGRRLMVIVANSAATPATTDPLYLVKDPDAGRGGFGPSPESAPDAQGDANDGWKLYSFDDVGTAYNL